MDLVISIYLNQMRTRGEGVRNPVGPACEVRGFVEEKLTLQECFSSLTLEQGNIIMNMPVLV